MRRILLTNLLLASFLAGCASTIGRAPGPEAPHLAGEASGTLIVPPVSGGWLYRTVRFVDLPSMRERAVRLEHDPVEIAGFDGEHRLIYAFDVDAGLTLDNQVRFVLGIQLEPRPTPRSERWHLRSVDVATSAERDLGVLADFPRVLALAPSGGRLIAAHDAAPVGPDRRYPPSDVWLIDLNPGVARRVVTHRVGRVLRCDWMPDGSAFALSGSDGGQLFDAANLTSCDPQAESFGPFTPDGSAYLSRREDGFALVSLADHEVRIADALLPWPATRGSARERGDADPIGLCGERLALYEALPTKGRPMEWSLSRGGYLLFEHPAVKVADLQAGTYATVLAGNESPWTPLFSPVRLEPIER
jgi:uncharacterized protein YceK